LGIVLSLPFIAKLSPVLFMTLSDTSKIVLVGPKTYEAPVVKEEPLKRETKITTLFMTWLKVAGDGT
jgi:hypothetical protein